MRTSSRVIAPAILVGFGVAMALMLGGGLAAFREQSEGFGAGDRSRQALRVILEIERVRDALVDAETGQRGYLLTGGDSYLEPYQRGAAQVAEDLARLRDMTKDDPKQQALLVALEPLVTTKLEELRRTIDARRSGDEARALAIVGTGAGKQAMDTIRAQLGEMESRESEQLGTVLAIRGVHRDHTLSLIVVLTTGAVVVMLVSLVLLARTERGRRRAGEKLRETEERLRTALSHKLAHSEERARAVLDTTVHAVISIDAEGRIETFNKAAEALFGYEPAEVIGQNVRLLMPPPYRAEHDGYLRRYLETGERRIIGIGREVTGLRKDGTLFPMALAVAETELHGQHIFTGLVRDLTQEKASEDRERTLLKQALQNARLADVGAMTARIAHDFGNPLAGLRMTAQRLRLLLARDPVPLDQLRRAADVIVETTDRLDGKVGEFKDFAREQRLDIRDLRAAHLPAGGRASLAAGGQRARHRARGRSCRPGSACPCGPREAPPRSRQPREERARKPSDAGQGRSG